MSLTEKPKNRQCSATAKLFFLHSMPLLLLSLLTVLLFISPLSAAPQSIDYKGLKLNAEFKQSNDKAQPFFLILHGTFAWHGMELPSTLQALLTEEDYGSLAISLSLGESDRNGFFDCKHPIISGHGDAQSEIEQWVNFLNQQGYQNIVLIGHSRGGAQIATYALKNPNRIKQIFLIAPMTWQQQTTSATFTANNKNSLSRLITKIQAGKIQQLPTQKVFHCKNTTISPQAFLSYYSRKPEKNTPSLLSAIKIPSKLYLGSDDPLSEKILSQKALFKKNNKVSYLVIEDADHFFRDFYADLLVTDMIESLIIEKQPEISIQIPLAKNLLLDGKLQKNKQRVIMLYVSAPQCPFCKRLEKEILKPMLRSGSYKNKVILRKINWRSLEPIINYQGNKQRPDELLTPYKIIATPTLLFLNGQGKEIAQRITGYQGSGFFWYYLDQSITLANQR